MPPATRTSKKNKGPKLPTQAEKSDEEVRIAALEKKLAIAEATAKAKSIATKPRAKLTAEERAWLAQVLKVVKKYVWGSVKFCNYDEKLTKLTGHVFDKWELREYEGLDEEALAEAKVQWVAQNSALVRISLNDCRNYAGSQLRSCMVNRITSDRDVPTPAEILDCATREPYLHEDDTKHWIMEFYWNDILFRIVGKDHWDTYIRHYNTISGAHIPGMDKPCITVGTEAFAVALYQNCYDRFHLIAEQQKAGIEDKKRTDPRHKTAMIDCDGGQAKWGGWNATGREYCSELRAKIKDARDRDHVLEMEADCLRRIRTAHDIEARDQRRGAARSRKRKIPEVVEEDDEEDMI